MVQTKEMKNYKTEVTDNNRIEYLHFFGIKYPFIETDGMKIASDELGMPYGTTRTHRKDLS